MGKRVVSWDVNNYHIIDKWKGWGLIGLGCLSRVSC